MSLIRILTTVVIAPPPIPANALAAINWPIVRERPQKRHPSPNIAYAVRSVGLRPNMSEIFPQRGWLVVRVKKYLAWS
jgi:hypothetical protein